MFNKDPNFIVGIGGSSGGLKAYITLLDNLPSNTGMAFVVISHMNPNEESFLARILSRKTSMPVVEASEGMAIQKNFVYVIPPNANLFIENFAFRVEYPRTLVGGRHMQVDYFLTSLANCMEKRAIGIIFSGADGDGTEGCKVIKAKGGITFAQDLSAEVNGMPRSAQAAGCVDFVMPPENISNTLVNISKGLAPQGNLYF